MYALKELEKNSREGGEQEKVSVVSGRPLLRSLLLQKARPWLLCDPFLPAG